MRIRTLWEHDGEPGHTPWLIAAVDEFTEEEHNGTPEFYQAELDKNPGKRRELIIEITHASVIKIFDIQTVKGRTNG